MIHLLPLSTFPSTSQSPTPSMIVKNQSHRVWFVPLQVAANCIMFIITMWVANWELAPFAQNPMIGPLPGDLTDSGGQTTYLLTCQQQWWRLFTSMYLPPSLPSSVRSPVLPLEGFSAFVAHIDKIVILQLLYGVCNAPPITSCWPE
jgi:hypothetical protein